ncbi:MAG: PEP-utilizing enzyme, partial [Dehalococcoidia bacterium]
PPASGFGRRIAITGFDGLPPEAAEANRALIGYMREIMAAPRIDAEPSGSHLLLHGIGAVRGYYTGTARVLRGEDDFDRLSPGDVLVCAVTSPAWAPVLPLAGALVTDHGGILSHPAVIAREFGIPAVVATRQATALIPDGALVEVDGERGVVRILGRDPGLNAGDQSAG